MKTPHIHAELIKQWADGAQIQYLSDKGWWLDATGAPSWRDTTAYRVKPEPKPDVVLYACIEKNDWKNITAAKVHACNADTRKTETDTVMFIFDGETGKLKDAQVLAKE